MTIDSYRGHTVLFTVLQEMKQTESVHVDTSALLSLRGVNRFFRDYVDGMFDPEHKIDAARVKSQQALGAFETEKASYLQTLQDEITEINTKLEVIKISKSKEQSEEQKELKAKLKCKSLLFEHTKNLQPNGSEIVFKTPESLKKSSFVAFFAKEAYSFTCAALFVKNRIFDLFEGRVAFEKLPVYDFGKLPVKRDNIVAENFIAPVMRSADNNFFIIRAVSKSTKEVGYQIFANSICRPSLLGSCSDDWYSEGDLLHFSSSLSSDKFIVSNRPLTKTEQVSVSWYNTFIRTPDEAAQGAADIFKFTTRIINLIKNSSVEIPGNMIRIANFIQNGGDSRYQIA